MNEDWISLKDRHTIADEQKAKFKSLYKRTGLVEENSRLNNFLFIKGSELLRYDRLPEYRYVRAVLQPYVHVRSNCCFISHRWLNSQHPDPDGRQMTALRSHIDPAAHYWVDFCCLPQKPRSCEDETIFREFMFLLPSLMFKRSFLVLRCKNDDYFERAWCFFELLAAHVLGCAVSYVFEGGASPAFQTESEQEVLQRTLIDGCLPKDLGCTDAIDMEAINQATETVVTFSLINVISHYLSLGQEISDQNYFFMEDRYYFLATCNFRRVLDWTYNSLSDLGMTLIDLSGSEHDGSIFSEMAKRKVFQHSTDINALPKEITLDANRFQWLSANRHSSDSAFNLFLLLSSMVTPLRPSEQASAPSIAAPRLPIREYLNHLVSQLGNRTSEVSSMEPPMSIQPFPFEDQSGSKETPQSSCVSPPTTTSKSVEALPGVPHSSVLEATSKVLIDSQLDYQSFGNPNRLSIEFDCPPGAPRPPEVLEMAIAGTGLSVDDFVDSGNLGFGCREYLVKREAEAIMRYRAATETLEDRLVSFQTRGLIRAATW